MLISIFICNSENNTSIIDNSLKCHSGGLFYFDSVLAVIVLILLLSFSYITILIFYIPNFILEEEELLKKSNSIPDLILFINKIAFVILFDFIKINESSQWLFLFFLFILTFANTWSTFYYNHYESGILTKLNQCLGLNLFWSIICLFLAKIFYVWNYNGSLHLFLFGSILIDLIFIYHKEKSNDLNSIEFKQIDSSETSLRYIKNFLILIKMRDKSRENFIIFKTLILLREENCINKNCKLKKYLQIAEKGYLADYLLYEYCQQLFEISIKKFPNDIILKANYIIYLIVQMSKKKLAQKVFITMKEYLLHFQNNYIIFCCKNIIESYSPGAKGVFEESNKNIMRAVEYEKLFHLFKDNLLKTSSLYYEFWTSLFKSNLQGTEDFIKLNNIGKKINSLNNTIEENFKKLYNVKSDDFIVVNLYSEFLKNILNNTTKFNDFKNAFFSFSNINKIQEKEIDYSNFDINILNSSDAFMYIITSAEESNFLDILNISLNACKKFGYFQNELIGKSVVILFPDKVRRIFFDIVTKYGIQIKTKFYDLLSQKKEYYPEFFEYFIDGITKSKYSYPQMVKTFYAQTEENDHVFVNEILNEVSVINIINKYFNTAQLDSIIGKELKVFNLCYVLTDSNFNIQIFTPNCQELLGLSSYAINSNIDITSYIVEFGEELNKIIYDKNPEHKKDANLINYMENFKKNQNNTLKTNIIQNNIYSEKILSHKKYIAEKKFSEARLINWKIYELFKSIVGNQNKNLNQYETFRSQNEIQNTHILFNNKNIFYGKEKQRKLLLVVKKADINDIQIGYRFFFKREKADDDEDELKSQNNQNNSIFKAKKYDSQRKNSVCFNSLDINNDTKNEEGEGIHSSRTANLKKFIKMSKSLKNNKNEQDIDAALIEKKSSKNFKVQNFEGVYDIFSPKKNNKKKFYRFPSSNDININDNDLLVDQDYIPMSNTNFILDLEPMSYKPLNYIIKADKNLPNILKNEAMAKINQLLEQKKNSKKLSSYSSSNSFYEESEEYEEDSSSLNSIRKEKTKKEKLDSPNKKEKIKENSLREEIEKEYYKVSGLNKIKYMEYDYEQEMIVDKGVQNNIKSEVENIIINYKLSIPMGMDEESIEPKFKIKKLISKTDLDKERSNLASSLNLINIGIKNKKSIYKEKEIYNKIDNALKKTDKEKLVIRLYVVIITCSIILLAICGFILYFIVSAFKIIITNIFLMICSINLRYNTNLGIYYCREIIVASAFYYDSHNKMIYYPFYENREEYLNKVTTKFKNVFFEGHENLELMLGMNFELDKNNTYYFKQKPFQIIIQSDFSNQRIITSTLSVCIVQVYSYFYHLIITDALQNQWEETFNFIGNALNNLSYGLEETIKIYLSELKIKNRKYFISTIVIFVCSSLIHIGIYYIVIKIYLEIIYRKESYISMFYDIKLSFIKSSILKCEKFINKINPIFREITQGKSVNSFNSISLSQFGQDLLFYDETNNGIKNKNKKLNNQKKKEIKYKEVSHIRIFKIKLIGILIFSMIFISVTLWRFIVVLEQSEIMTLYMYTMQHYHNNILNLGNAFREFIFLNFTEMHNTPIYEYLGEAEKELYGTFIPDVIFMTDNCNVIKGLCDLYSDIQKTPYCSKETEKELNDTNECNYYMEVLTSLGFYNFISFFIEEIRIKKNYILLKDKENHLEQITFFNIDKFVNRTIDYYNEPGIQLDINNMLVNIIFPTISKEKNETAKLILREINSKPLIYSLILCIYFLIIILLDIFFWNPIIKGIKGLIYKTKNMLTIIPVEILEAQTNIKNLLGISDFN